MFAHLSNRRIFLKSNFAIIAGINLKRVTFPNPHCAANLSSELQLVLNHQSGEQFLLLSWFLFPPFFQIVSLVSASAAKIYKKICWNPPIFPAFKRKDFLPTHSKKRKRATYIWYFSLESNFLCSQNDINFWKFQMGNAIIKTIVISTNPKEVSGMKAKRQFTLRLDEALLNKLGYIAEYEGRTKNKEIQHLIQQHIVHFEQEHGAIDLREIQQEEPMSMTLQDCVVQRIYRLLIQWTGRWNSFPNNVGFRWQNWNLWWNGKPLIGL